MSLKSDLLKKLASGEPVPPIRNYLTGTLSCPLHYQLRGDGLCYPEDWEGEYDPGPVLGGTKGEAINPGSAGDLAVSASQLTQEGFLTYQNIVLGLILYKFAQMPGGIQTIREIGKEFVKGIFDTLHSLGQASSSNKVASWANPTLICAVLDRFGFVERSFVTPYFVGLSIISGSEVIDSFLDTLQGLFPFSTPEPSEYPSTIVFSPRESGKVELPETISWKEFTELQKATK